MTARCRIPPENWCGYIPRPSDGIGDIDLSQKFGRAGAGSYARRAVRDLALGDLASDRQEGFRVVVGS